MQFRWEYLTPPEFKKLAAEEQLCLLPIGSLERHGEHMPYGSDALIAHQIACSAAEKEPCFAGTVNFPTDLLAKMLETLLDQIAQNGFKKILIISGHGGNTDFLKYFAMSQLDREVDYTLYNAFAYGGPRFKALKIWERPGGGHADEAETSMAMAAIPGTVKMEQHGYAEPVLPRDDLSHLEEKRIHSALWWHAMYPENVTGTPSAATLEKGKAALEAAVSDLEDIIRTVKEDTAAPRLQKEFYASVHAVKACK